LDCYSQVAKIFERPSYMSENRNSCSANKDIMEVGINQIRSTLWLCSYFMK